VAGPRDGVLWQRLNAMQELSEHVFDEGKWKFNGH
jgi:hypothetical protein